MAIGTILLDDHDLFDLLSINAFEQEEWAKDGTLGPEPVMLKGRRLWMAKEIRQWLRAGCPNRKAWEQVQFAQSLKGLQL